MGLSPWSPTLKIIACSFHSVAIACTIFRLIYRLYMVRFWWEDGWAALALAADVVCFVSVVLEAPTTAQGTSPIDNITDWMTAMTFTCVLWACRISILLSIARVANPSQRLRRIMFLVGCSFVVMWAALLGQKIHVCVKNGCIMTFSIGVSLLFTNVISDFALVGLPIYLLRRTKITRRQRIMIFSVFSASLSTTVVTILYSVALFTGMSNMIMIIGHVRTALSLIVCNLLVIVAFIYRVYRRGRAGDLDAPEEVVSFTNVDLNTWLSESGVDKTDVCASMTSDGSWSSHRQGRREGGGGYII